MKNQNRKIWSGIVIALERISSMRNGIEIWIVSFKSGKAMYVTSSSNTLDITEGDFIAFKGAINNELNYFIIDAILSRKFKDEQFKKNEEIITLRNWLSGYESKSKI